MLREGRNTKCATESISIYNGISVTTERVEYGGGSRKLQRRFDFDLRDGGEKSGGSAPCPWVGT